MAPHHPSLGAGISRDLAYSAKGAHVAGIRMLRIATVQAAIAEARRALLAGDIMEAQEVLARRTALARASMGDYVRWDAQGNLTLVPSDQLTPAQLYAIEEISEEPAMHGKVEKGKAVKIKLRSPEPSLKDLTRYHSILPTTGVQVGTGPRGTSVNVTAGDEVGQVMGAATGRSRCHRSRER